MRQKALIGTALLFYLTVQWYAVWFMQYNHPGPLGLDDATAYISNISYSRDFPLNILSSPDMDQVSWSWFWGVTARVLGLTPEAMFSANFYVGLFLMGLVLATLFRKIDPSPWLACVGLVLFAFYEGNGAYHGFFWVVPSFYAIMLFLLGAIALRGKSHRLSFSLPVILLLVTTHTTGIYLAALLLLALFINDVVWEKNIRAMGLIAIFTLGAALLLIGAEHLFHVNFIPLSKLTWKPGQQFPGPEAFSEPLRRYHFAKYYYGLFTPILAYGIHAAVREKKRLPISLLLAALMGYILLGPFVEYNARLFYPLEVVTWIVMAYGISHALRQLAARGKPYGHPVRILHIAILALSALFAYNALHQKVDHNYFYKFYHPRYFDQEAFFDHLEARPTKKAAIYTSLPNHYRGLAGGWKNPQYMFRPDTKTIADHPNDWLVIGEQHRYYEACVTGFRVEIPVDATLHISLPGCGPGRYRVELRDTGLQSAAGIALRITGANLGEWKEKPEAIRLPAADMQPPLLLPWYLNPEKRWPLFRRPIHPDSVVRHTPAFSMEFETRAPLGKLQLVNTGGEAIALNGVLSVTNLDTGEKRLLDLYWGEAGTLNDVLSLELRGRLHPLLWSDPEDPGDWLGLLQHPGKQYRFVLEKNFMDVKAFSIYTNPL